MRYAVVIYPVSRPQTAVIKLILRILGPNNKEKAEMLAQKGGTILKNINREAATNLVNQLRKLGAQVEIKRMEEEDNKDISSIYTIRLIDAGEHELRVVKVIRDITGLGLKESKKLVDNLDIVAEQVTLKEAERIRKILEKEGAKVLVRQHKEIKPTPLKKHERDQRKDSDSHNDIKIIFNGNKNTVVIETHSGHELQISEKNNSLLLEDQHGNKISLSQNGVLVI